MEDKLEGVVEELFPRVGPFCVLRHGTSVGRDGEAVFAVGGEAFVVQVGERFHEGEVGDVICHWDEFAEEEMNVRACGVSTPCDGLGCDIWYYVVQCVHGQVFLPHYGLPDITLCELLMSLVQRLIHSERWKIQTLRKNERSEPSACLVWISNVRVQPHQ